MYPANRAVCSSTPNGQYSMLCANFPENYHSHSRRHTAYYGFPFQIKPWLLVTKIFSGRPPPFLSGSGKSAGWAIRARAADTGPHETGAAHQFLGFWGAALGADNLFPVSGEDQFFKAMPALFTFIFIDRHEISSFTLEYPHRLKIPEDSRYFVSPCKVRRP